MLMTKKDIREISFLIMTTHVQKFLSLHHKIYFYAEICYLNSSWIHGTLFKKYFKNTITTKYLI